ncbi:MAG: hypothetical protein KF768_02930 [Phycisphaeraceae bacterium]|nr:hypothetical protein [Phycisphaeraceae bacterium]
MLQRTVVIMFLAGFGLVLGALAPEPAPVPTRWQLEIEPGPLRVVSVDIPNLGPRMFAYMTYRVENNSGQDVLFAPSFELSDGEGNVVRSGRDVPQAANAAVFDLIQNPLAEDQISIIGELTQGKENGKDGYVIWILNDMNPQAMTVYAAGFSGETATVEIKGADGKPQRFILRKTLMLDYQVPGTLEGQRLRPLGLRSRSWIMR